MKKLFVIGMAILLLVVFTMPAMAKVKIGGIVFTDFYYIDRDKVNAKGYGAGGDGTVSYNATVMQLPAITRLYSRWTNEDNVGMYIEFGLGQTTPKIVGASDSGVNLRHAYGWWDVNPMFQILAGKTTTPSSPLNPSQMIGYMSGSLNIIGMGYGEYYAGRFVQVRGTFKFGKSVRLAVALVDPNAAYVGQTEVAQTSGVNSTKIPRIDVGLPIYLGPVSIYPSFAWQRTSYDNATFGGGDPVDNNITSYIGSLGAKAGFGPFGVSGEINIGQNFANIRGGFGASPSGAWKAAGTGANPITAATVGDDNQLRNSDTFSFWIDLSYKFGPITPHLIYGLQQSKSILGPNSLNLSRNLKTKTRTQMIGFSVPIQLAKGFTIRPEVMWYDDGKGEIDTQTSEDFGKYMLAGVQFQITF